MITGDKLETAENIGMMSGIINQNMAVFYLRDINKTNFIEKVKKLKHEIQKSEIGKNGIIFDMRELGILFISNLFRLHIH